MPIVATPAPDEDPNGKATFTREEFAAFRAELLATLSQSLSGSNAFKPVPLARFVPDFLSFYTDKLRARSTRSRMSQVLRIVVELAGPNATTADLTPALLSRFIAGRPAGESPHTTNGMLRALRVACNHAVSQGMLRVSPFAGRSPFLRESAVLAAKRRHHEIAAISRALATAKADIDRKVPGSWSQWRARRLYVLVSVAAYTGMRRNEILYLRVEDVDIPNRVISIVSRSSNRLKTEASAAPIPMVEPLAAVLAEWFPHLAIPPDLPETAPDWAPEDNPDGIRDDGWLIPNVYRTGPWIGGRSGSGRPIDRLKRLGERCGIEGFTFQSLRHSFGTHAESAWGLSDLQIQRILRHTTTRTQKRYRHADMANLRAAVAGVGFGGDPVAPPPAIVETAAAAFAPPVDPTAPPPVVGGSPDPKNPSKPGVYHRPKLEPADVVEMKELRSRGWTYTKLRERYRVSKSTLHAALHGFTHKGS